MPAHDRSAAAARLRAAGCVFADEEAQLLSSAAAIAADFEAMVSRRVSGLPLEQVIGWAEFCGLRVAVEPGVFVPRRRSEFLVRQAIALAPPRPVVIDLCCGSGALGVALAAALPGTELHAADVDPAAAGCARRNVIPAGGQVYAGDLYDALPAALRGRADLLIANVPYVPTGEIPLLPAEASKHEPLRALDGGADGLDVLRRVAAQAARWLAPAGHLLAEASERQAELARGVLERSGLIARVAGAGELDATVIIGSRPG